MRRTAGCCVSATVLLAGTVGVHAQNPTLNNPNFDDQGHAFTVATGWTSFGGNKWESAFDPPRAWVQGVSEMDTNGGIGGVRQTFAVTSGASYRITVLARVTHTDLDAALGVQPGGSTDANTATYSTTTSSTGWTTLTRDFTAAGTSATVFLRGRNPKPWPLNGAWALFDMVQVERLGGGGNSPPTAVAFGSPLSGEAPLNVNFNGSGSSDPDVGQTLTYRWNFGDGANGSGEVTSHTYNADGTFTVVLTVSDGNGGTDTDSLTVTVGDSEPPGEGNLVSNPGFEENFSGGLGSGWQSWQQGGSGYWRQSTRLGRIGAGLYSGSAGFSQTVRLAAKTVLVSDLALGHAPGLRQALPDAIIVGRLFIDPLFDTYISDPEFYGRVHADNCFQTHIEKPGISAWQGMNEPNMNNADDVARRIARFEKAFADRCHELGIKACVFNFATGNPAGPNFGLGRMLMQEVIDCLAIADYVGYHPYGGPDGQLMMEPPPARDAFSMRWRIYANEYASRGLRMPPVLYTECTTFFGWRGVYTSAHIRDDLIAYEAASRNDPWAVGMMIFLVGGPQNWALWEVGDQPTIYEGAGDWNLAHPADAHEGLYSQQFGENSGGFTGGIRQVVSVNPGHTYRFEHWMKYETYGVPTNVAYQVGYDTTGQTSNPSAGSIVWTSDLIDTQRRETDIWYKHSTTFNAAGSSVSLWFRGSQPSGLKPWRVMVDEVSLVDTDPNPPQNPAIARSPSSLSRSIQQGQNAASQQFTIRNSGQGTLNYSITDNIGWLSVSPGGGQSTGETDTITVNYNTTGLTPGNHGGVITISDPSATNNPQTINVTVIVNNAPFAPVDFDQDGDVDHSDFGRFQTCLTGPGIPQTATECQPAKLDGDVDVDQDDFGIFQACFSGPTIAADINCAN